MSLNPPASLEDIDAVESALDLTVPRCVADMYSSLGDGGELDEGQVLRHAGEEAVVEFFLELTPPAEIGSVIEVTQTYREEDDLAPHFVAFAVTLADDPFLFDSRFDDAPVSLYVRDTAFENHRPLGLSFVEFWETIEADGD